MATKKAIVSLADEALASIHDKGVSSAEEAMQLCDEFLKEKGATAEDYDELRRIMSPRRSSHML